MGVLMNVPYLHDPEVWWIYIVGRVKPGVSVAALHDKVNAVLRQQFATFKDFKTERGKVLLGRAHIVLTPGGAGIQQMQENYGSHLHLLTWVAGLVLLVACANIAICCW